MLNRIVAALVGAGVAVLGFQAMAQTSQSNTVLITPLYDPTPAAAICRSGVVIKQLLFDWLADGSGLSGPLYRSWRQIMTSVDACSAMACKPGDAGAIATIKRRYAKFLSDAQYTPTNPALTAEQYFKGADKANAITCTGPDQTSARLSSAVASTAAPTPAASAATAAAASSTILDQIRIRGVSDDLWISQANDAALFSKSSSATAGYTQNDVYPSSTTTSITAAVGYDILPDVWGYGALVPYVSGNATLIDTYRKPRNNSASNFIAGGILYQNDFSIPGSNVENQITVKPQQVDGTTMHSELTSLQLVYAPYTNPVGVIPALNSVESFPALAGTVPIYFDQLIFDLRNDFGYYEDRGVPKYISQNVSYERFGSKFGYAFIGNPPNLPAFSLSVTETALYGTSGGPRDLSYFDALLQIFFDSKKLFSANAEYINGREENTYVITHQYKLGLSAHY